MPSAELPHVGARRAFYFARVALRGGVAHGFKGLNVAIGASVLTLGSALIAADFVILILMGVPAILMVLLIGAYRMWSDAAAALADVRRAPVPDGHLEALRAHVAGVRSEFEHPHPAFVSLDSR